jgi:hypothetical protein
MNARVAALLAAIALCSGSSLAVAAAPPDLSGVWSIKGTHATLKTTDGKAPPLTPAGKAAYDKNLAAAAKGKRSSFDGTSICLPPGLPRLMLANEPFEILQREKTIYFVHQLNRLPRRAYVGEKLPEDEDPLYLGYSVARWDGAALIIESGSFRDDTVLDDSGLPHSPALKVTERYELGKDGNTLHARFTIEDPATFTRARTTDADYVKKPGFEIPEDVCAEKLVRMKK